MKMGGVEGKPIVFLSTGICRLWLDRVVDRLCWPTYSVRFRECDIKLKRFVCILFFWKRKQANAV